MYFPHPKEDASVALDGGSPIRQGLINPLTALRILRRETGGAMSRSAFYRWVNTGKVLSVRVGRRIYIPLYSLNDVIKQCVQGERL